MSVLLKTERLTLRHFTANDADNLFALDNDSDVMRYLNGGIPTSRAAIENEILPNFLYYDDQQPGFGFWAVDHKTSGEFLGWISFRPTGDSDGEASIGYRFRKAAWGQGYATEGCQAIIAKGFTGLGVKRVVATTYQDNLASQRVMEKLGMTLVRRFRITPEELGQTDTFSVDSTDVWDGDDLEYALERNDWTSGTAVPI